MNRIEITKPMIGICYMQVCAIHDVTDEEILEYANEHNPAGTENGWVEVAREDHKDSNRHPVVCEDNIDRRHFILIC